MSAEIDDELRELEEEFGLLESPDDTLLELETDASVTALATLYFLRMLSSRGELGRLYRKNFGAETLAEPYEEVWRMLALPAPRASKNAGDASAFLTRAWRSACAQRDRLEAASVEVPKLSQGLEAFRRHLALDPGESGVLAFACVLHSIGWLRGVVDAAFGRIGSRRTVELVARALALAPREVAAAVSPRSTLVRAGLISWCGMGPYTLNGRLECAQGLARALLVQGSGPRDFLSRQCQPAPQTELTLADFSYLERETRVMVRLLSEARQRKTPGVNLLLYGEPGTGKTELARVLAAAAGSDLWEVGCRNEEEDAISATERLRYLRFGQSVLSEQTKSLLLFDEAEDVFQEDLIPMLGLRARRETRGKAWFNQLLEHNSVPTIWLSNSTLGIDGAHLRRFLYLLEVPRPPRRVRQRILERELAPAGVPKGWLERVSADERLVPGHITRARQLVQHLGTVTPEEARGAAEQALANTLRATGEGRALKGREEPVTRYNPEFLNADTDLEVLAAGVAARGAGRLCFYGPPGTGKSAFARHLAERVGKELHVRRASDLLSCWVGGSEQNIAEMFRQASREGAAILLDEADSFLASREGASHSWEVTQVNELLTQMEGFEGLFIASTNLMDRLDYASLRRFDCKIHFGYLRPEQASALLLQVFKEHHVRIRATDRTAVDETASLSNLTPGDIAAVIRRARLANSPTDLAWWIESVAQECTAKVDSPRRGIGFLT